MRSLMPKSVNDTCRIEVTLEGKTWREERDGAVTMGFVVQEVPASVRVMEPDSDHFHQGYLTSWYAAPYYDRRTGYGYTAPDDWWNEYECDVVFYGYLECFCW